MIELGSVRSAVAALDPAWLSEQRWFGGKGRGIAALGLANAFALDGRSVLAIVRVSFADGSRQRISVPFTSATAGGTATDASIVLRPADAGDGAWRALATAAAEGRVVPALEDPGLDPDRPRAITAALVCRPSGHLDDLLGGAATPERALGVDQSNTSVVLGERVVLKAFRGIETGLEPDLELTAFLSEEAPFGAVPPLVGSVELVSSEDGVATIALLTEYVPDAVDGYESTAETLTTWLLAPGEVTVEFASEDAADLGLLTAALHAALVSRPEVEGFEVRPATHDELRSWRVGAEEGLERAIALTEGSVRERLRQAAPEIVARLSVHEALASAPLVSRIHGDLHLGQVMRSEDGWRIIDFEGEPTRSIDERRRHASPLRDVASMLRSLHHIGLSAARRADERTIERGSGPLTAPGLDMDGWLRRSRERFLAAYRHGLRHAGVSSLDVDDDLLLAFELEKAVYEFVYAVTYLPSWSEIALGGLEGLLGWAGESAR